MNSSVGVNEASHGPGPMRVGVGLPATLAGVTGNAILEWAALADAGPFSTLAIIDRLVYPNYEPLVTLAAVSAVARRPRLMTTVLLAALRSPAILAKQVATLDALAGGRLSLGLGVGGRADDFRAAGTSMQDRGRRFEEALRQMKLAWSGEATAAGPGPIGPGPVQPGGPPLLIGGTAPAALERIGQWGDGYLAPDSDPASTRARYAAVLDAWQRHDRGGRPQLINTAHFALGPDAGEAARAHILDYYAFRGSAAQARVLAVLTSPEAVRDAIERCQDAGADELILWPCSPALDQVHRLADIL